MQAKAIECVTENEDFAHLGIVEGFQSEVIARTKQFFLARIPDRKSEIPEQVPHAFLTPKSIGLQNQFGVCYSLAIIWFCLLEFALQFIATIDSRVGRDPKLPGQAGRLLLAYRFSGRSQHRVAKPDAAVRIRVSPIWTHVAEKICEGPKECAIDGRTASVEHAYDSAQCVSVPIDVACPSNGEKWRCSSPKPFRIAPRNSTQACASKRFRSFRAPIFSSAAIPRIRSSHQSTSDCSRQFVPKKRFRAAAS